MDAVLHNLLMIVVMYVAGLLWVGVMYCITYALNLLDCTTSAWLNDTELTSDQLTVGVTDYVPWWVTPILAPLLTFMFFGYVILVSVTIVADILRQKIVPMFKVKKMQLKPVWMSNSRVALIINNYLRKK